MNGRSLVQVHRGLLRVTLLALMLLGALPGAQPTAALTLTHMVPVGTHPFGVAVNPITNRIYTANVNSDTVSVIDAPNYPAPTFHYLFTTIPIGDGPNGVRDEPASIAVNPATNRIYVANQASDTVSVIDGATNRVMATITIRDGRSGLLRDRPHGVAVNAATNRVYVTNNEGDSVSVIDGSANRVIQTTRVGDQPTAVAVNATSNRVYVANAASGTISVIDGISGAVIDTISVGSSVYGVAVDATTNHVYVTNSTGVSAGCQVLQDPG